jgi:hypothetical protein
MTNVEAHWLDCLLELEEGLTEWELEFIENLDSNWREKGLSDKQRDTLERIYDRLC